MPDDIDSIEVAEIGEKVEVSGDLHESRIHPHQVFQERERYEIISFTDLTQVDDQLVDDLLRQYEPHTAQGDYAIQFRTTEGAVFYGTLDEEDLPQEWLESF